MISKEDDRELENMELKPGDKKSSVEERVMPPQLAEVIKKFPLREPDRVVEGPNGEWLAEWQMADNYFEIECTVEGKLEIMTRFDGEFKHWDLG